MEEENVKQESSETKSGFIRMRKMNFILLLAFAIILSIGVTSFALTFGDGKAISVSDERQQFSKLYAAYDTLKNSYFQDIDDEKLINGAINGMVDSLNDPYSDYMSVEEAKSFHQSISSSFEGIGAEIQEKDGFIVIVTPIKGSPAEEAGLKPNDKVLAVDGKSLQGISSSEAVTMIRGEKGTKVTLSIQRPGVEEAMSVPIIRDTIPIETVYGEMVDDHIAKVQITSFSENTSNELIETLTELKAKGMKGLILDLRQNPGGLLNQAIDISSMFVPGGKTIFQIEDRNGNRKKVPSKGKNNPDVALVVVIDKGSASASEILAGAVKESANVPLIGEKSFGKGTVQRAEEFTDGSNMKFTTEKWLTPDGNWIHQKGIKPDYEVKLPEYASLPFINPDEELSLSSSSSQVKAAQQMLKAVGYDPGREDGFFDEKTKNAVESFQRDEKLKVNGTLTGQSTIALMEKLRDKLRENDPQLQKAIEILKKEIEK
ncbi:S41 family peptidase [Bacillus sp. Bva_UNVM-123]|uniref:lmo1851 family serine protease n=1 Tax=Bacillus sp. Bva_UNVM-123 TaxID=2829798 RepID=UPI00391FAEB7